MKYYYSDPQDIIDKNLTCTDRNFNKIDSDDFTNEQLLDFIDENYNKVFTEKGIESPFTFSEDYIRSTYNDLCNTSSYELKPQQKFVGQLVNPYSNIKNMLIYHGLGSGKTCTSLMIGEAFANIKNRETFYIVPAALEQPYIDEIVGEIRNLVIQSCTSMCLVFDFAENRYQRAFYTSVSEKRAIDINKQKLDKLLLNKKEITDALEVEKNRENLKTLNEKLNKLTISIKQTEISIKTLENQVMKKVKKVFTITTHQKFIDRLIKITDSGQIILQEYLQTGSSLFKNSTTIIIDEIQNLVSEKGKRYKVLYNAIKYYINPNVRKVFLSATPIYDNAYELALTINLLLPRVPFSTNSDTFYNTFVGKIKQEDGKIECIPREEEKIDYSNACLINKDLFKYICSGYVSYFKGGNPVAYPYKRIIELNHVLDNQHKIQYISSLRKDIVQDIYRVLNKIEKVKTISEGILINEYSEAEVSGTMIHARQGINISFPTLTLISDDESLDGSTLSLSEKTSIIIKQNKEALRKELQSDSYEEILEKLGKLSIKIKSIIEISLTSTGPVFIYSNWLGYGVEAISVVLDVLGYSKFPKITEDYKSYFVWSPSVENDPVIIKKARQTFNSVENADGKLIKFILGTSSIKEGVSFKNLSQIHILDPWWNNSRINQIEARGVRLCSHADLIPEKRHVDIYKHVGVFESYYTDSGEDPDISALFDEIYDQFIMNKYYRPSIPTDLDPSIRKILNRLEKNKVKEAVNFVFNSLKWTKYITIDQKIMNTANEKTILNNKFERELKSVGVDCELFKNGNLIRLEEHIKQIKPDEYQIYFKNPSTLINYFRESIPESINFMQMIDRQYSYPNTKSFPLSFTRVRFDGDKFFIRTGETNKINSPTINEDLVMNEDIKCWKSPLTLDTISATDPLIIDNFKNKQKMRKLLNSIRIQFLGQVNDDLNNGIKFSDNDRLKRIRIINCYKKILKSPTLEKSLKVKIEKQLGIFKDYEDVNEKVMDIARAFSYKNSSQINNLFELALKHRTLFDKQYSLLKK